MLMNIEMNAMRFYAYHGVLPQENTVGAAYEVDLKLQTNVCKTAYLNDELSGTVNYAKVFEVVRTEMMRPSQLLEHLVHRINVQLLEQFPLVVSAETKVTKIAPPIVGAQLHGSCVCATLNRNQDLTSDK